MNDDWVEVDDWQDVGISPLDIAKTFATKGAERATLPFLPPELSEAYLTNPQETLKAHLGAGATSMALTNPISTLLALGARRIMETQPITQATDISKQYVEKIPRRLLGFPEPTMGAIGTLGEIARKTTPEQYREIPKTVAEIGAFVAGRKPEQFIKSKLPKVYNDIWLQNQAAKTYTIADQTQKTAGKEIEQFYGDVGDTPVKYKPLQNVVDDLFGVSKKYATKEMPIIDEELQGALRSAIEETPNVNISKAYKIKKILEQVIPDSVWLKGKKGVTLTPQQETLVNSYFKVNKIIKDSLIENGLNEEASFLEYINKKYSNVARLSGVIKRMTLDETGTPRKTSQLLSTFMGKPETAGRRGLFTELGQLNEDVSSLVKEMGNYRKRQILKRGLKKAGIISGSIVGAGILGKLGYDIFNE